MRLSERRLRLAFRAVVARVAIGDDEVARARWWRWIEEAAPARQSCPGRLTVSLEDILRSRGIGRLGMIA